MLARPPFVRISLALLALSGVAHAQEGKPASGDDGGIARSKGAPPPKPADATRAETARPADTVTTGTSPPPNPVSDGAPGAAKPEAPADSAPRSTGDVTRPPPLHVEYAQYGVAILTLINVDAGATCGKNVHPLGSAAPCILGSGAGLVIRAGYRSPGPWYIGGAYAFSKMGDSDLYRLGILQQIWGEMRYLPDTGYRVSPFATWGVGVVAYGNEWGVETGGTSFFAGGGLQLEVSRVAVIGLGFVYKPTIIAAWQDTAGYQRPAGVAQFLGLDFQLEVRTETGRR